MLIVGWHVVKFIVPPPPHKHSFASYCDSSDWENVHLEIPFVLGIKTKREDPELYTFAVYERCLEHWAQNIFS